MRDDFSQKVKDELAKRVGYLCSNPQCRKVTIGAQNAQDGTINIGEAAHICAASKGGKRYDETMTPEQRADISNGIWLCRNCAAMIDRDEAFFTKEILHLWKQLAEREANQAIVLGRTIEGIRKLSKSDREILDIIIEKMENSSTMYMLKEHDFHGSFYRNSLDPLFDLLFYFQKPTSIFSNIELQDVTNELYGKINTFRGMIALKGGPAKYGDGVYVIDREPDQQACNDICDEIWSIYEKIVMVSKNFD